MPRGSKAAYTSKQKRKAEHIEEGYEKRGTSKKEAERRAWATVSKESGGGKKSGSGRGKKESHASSRKGGKVGGRATGPTAPSAMSSDDCHSGFALARAPDWPPLMAPALPRRRGILGRARESRLRERSRSAGGDLADQER